MFVCMSLSNQDFGVYFLSNKLSYLCLSRKTSVILVSCRTPPGPFPNVSGPSGGGFRVTRSIRPLPIIALEGTRAGGRAATRWFPHTVALGCKLSICYWDVAGATIIALTGRAEEAIIKPEMPLFSGDLVRYL